ncbi:MAG: hypothetical protein ACLRZ9_06075 [Eubacterium sp.]
MRTIEKVFKELDTELSYMENPYNEPPKDYEYKDSRKLLAELIEIHKAEKERIIQALEEKIKFSHVSVSGGRANGKITDYGYKIGLCDALELIKKAGVENE